MKFCPVPFNNIHLDPGGGVRLCAWTDICIGNLLEESIEQIWHGERATHLRESFADGSFHFCRKTSCPYLENNSLRDVSAEEYIHLSTVPETPRYISAAHDFFCNHSCPSCRQEMFKLKAGYLENFAKTEDKVVELLNQADGFVSCGNGDIFASPHMMHLLAKVHPTNRNCTIALETNGAMFDKIHWEKISHFGDYHLSVTVTPNSYDETTYKYLNGGHDDYSKLMQNLSFICDLREREIVNNYEISIVIQERNFLELPSFIQRSIDDFKVDRVIVKPLYNWFCMSDEDYWFKDVANPLHPYHDEWIKIMNAPIMNDEHVFLWGARNIHEPMRHPAYNFEDMLKCLATLTVMQNREEKMIKWLKDKKAKYIILYGENHLTEAVVKLLKEEAPIKSIMTRTPNNKKIMGVCVIPFIKENIDKDSVVVVLNYDKFRFVKRDFDFMGVGDKVFAFNEMINQL